MKLPGHGQKPHLYFIITIPKHYDGRAVVVGLTSHLDLTTNPLYVFQRSDHPSIEHKSYVKYSSLLLGNMDQLERAFLKPGCLYWRDRAAASETVYKIQQEALRSPHLDPQQQNLIERAISEI